MNRLVTTLTQRFSALTFRSCQFHSPSSSLIVPSLPHQTPGPILDDFPTHRDRAGPDRIIPLTCPPTNAGKVYSLPSLLNNAPRLTPPPQSQRIVKVDPELEKAPMEAPSAFPVVSMYMAPRLLTIRRKKMKKHKRRKRYDRDFFKYQKYHREKKLKAEREFVKRMKAHLAELEAFNPENYVEETIARAKREWSDELAPTGRKLYPHWSRLMALEELYGLPKSDYIDKRAGYPTEEDRERIKQLKEQYRREFLGQSVPVEDGKGK